MFAAGGRSPEAVKPSSHGRPPHVTRAQHAAAMHKLASLSAELKSKVQDASSAISDVRQRVTQQMLEGTGYADKTDEEDFPELETHVSRAPLPASNAVGRKDVCPRPRGEAAPPPWQRWHGGSTPGML
jgi:hypothetical protein